MVRFYNTLQNGAPLDTPSHMAYISAVSKPNKDPEYVGKYCPISLRYNDQKLFTKVLANRLSSSIQQNMHNDQVGFIPGRQGPDQIRRAIDVISRMQAS